MPSERPQYRYTSTFTSVAKIATISDADRFVAKASLAPLRGLLPADIDPAADPDLLYISSDGAVGGLINANGDGITAETAVRIHRSARHKFVDVDHDRDRIAGVVLFPALTTLDTHRVLNESEALELNEPFHMSFAGVLWKAVQPLLTRYLVRVGDALDSTALSMSWEIAFDSYVIAVGSRNLFDARMVMPEDADFDKLDKCLRSRGGKGKTADGQDVFRVITGDPLILGYSIVPNPAASVKGILPITGEPEETPAAPEPPVVEVEVPAQVEVPVVEEPVSTTPAAPAPALSSASECIAEPAPSAPESTPNPAPVTASPEDFSRTNTKTCVTSYTAPMKIESLAQLTSQWDELRKMESAASVEAFVSALQAANDKYAADLAAQEGMLKSLQEAQATAEQAKAAAELKATELQASLATVQKQIEDLKSAALAAEQNAKYIERMASLDEAFSLDDEDRELLAADVRACADDAAFAAFMKKQEKLMAAKKKGDEKCAGKSGKPSKKEDDDDDEDEEEAKKKKAAAAESAAVVTEAIASVTPVEGEPKIPAGPVATDNTLADEMQAAFGSTFKIDGKSVNDRKAAKSAKAPKE